uniref:Uncharacterized protein n=1 Tax=Glossina brevipalpis TaxID=37001 RepID=A0A1A9W3K4_9MUSC
MTLELGNSSTDFKTDEYSDNSGVQITDEIGFRTANGKGISISEEGKKRLESLRKEFNESASNAMLRTIYFIISKRNNLLSQKKNIKTSLKRGREEDYSKNAGKLPTN